MADFLIGEDFHGSRADRFLRKTFSEIPLSRLYKDLREKKICCNGKPLREKDRLSAGDLITVPYEKKTQCAEVVYDGSPFPYPLLYEDEQMAVIDKPGGVVVHKGSGHKEGITEMFRRAFALPEASPAHRLDKATSGLFIMAKNRAAVRKLTALIREGGVLKHYIAVVSGDVPPGTMLMHDKIIREEDGSRISLSQGKEALGELKLMKRGDGLSLVEIRLITGRTHQIRLQLAARGWPIIGDGRYGIKRNGPMYLCSWRLFIPSMEVHIQKNIPESFIEVLNQGIL